MRTPKYQTPKPPGPLFVGTKQIKALRTAALVDSEIKGCLLWELLVMLLCLNSGLGKESCWVSSGASFAHQGSSKNPTAGAAGLPGLQSL